MKCYADLLMINVEGEKGEREKTEQIPISSAVVGPSSLGAEPKHEWVQ